MSFERINDREYQHKLPNQKILRFKIVDKRISDETAYYLVQKALKSLPQDYDGFITHRFRYGQHKWKVVRPNDLSWVETILIYLFPFFKFLPPADKVIQFEIDSAFFGPSKKPNKQSSLVIRRNKRAWKNITGSTLERSNYKRFQKLAGTNEITETMYQQGVRGHVDLQAWNSPHEDPFTFLAARSFQIGEANFKGRDYFEFNKARHCFIKNGNELKLVHRNSPLATVKNKQEALLAYLNFLTTQYGKEKLDYIDHLYKLDISQATELTSEHVYRFNIGTTNVEIQDIEKLSESLRNLPSLELDRSFLESAQGQIPLKQVLAIHKFLKEKTKKDQPTLGDLQQFHPTMGELISLVYPTKEEKEIAYTGRKITQVIQSAYTIADVKEYKPWIDQQEVTQISEQLKACSSWESYHELLAHVLVKKHLVRLHPTEGLRVGALIPAPLGRGWYKVSRFVTNQYTYSYELESVAGNLPQIKLYRSTASSEYAAYATKSIANNFCQINSPGYLGIKMMNSYEKDFFSSRTVPVFVAYQHAAEKILQAENPDLIKATNLLTQANESLKKLDQKPLEKKSLRQIIRENDAILNDLFLRFSHVLGAKSEDSNDKYLEIYKKLIEHFIIKDNSSSDRISKRYALRLKKILEKFLKKTTQFSERDHTLMRILVAELESLLLDEKDRVKPAPIVVPDPKDPFQWCQELKNIAIQRKENIESKLAENIDLCGHSLGGACLAAGFMEHVIKQDRVPLPQQSIRLFEFDAPGINDQDNECFKDFGNQHADLLNHLQIGFYLTRRQEAGDFLPRGGETHLGATYTDPETKQVQGWLQFDASVNERLPTSTNTEISESTSFHATRFAEGVVGVDYTKTPITSKDQGIFDSHGKKGDLPPHQAHQRHQDLFYGVWKMPLFFETYGCEESRKQIGRPWMWMRRILFQNRVDAHQMSSSFLDIYGCCAVDAKSGIISSV